MFITGYYDGAVIHVDEFLQVNQKVIVIPIENEMDLEESAAGGLHKYANPSLIGAEKDAWRKATIGRYTMTGESDNEKGAMENGNIYWRSW